MTMAWTWFQIIADVDVKSEWQLLEFRKLKCPHPAYLNALRLQRLAFREIKDCEMRNKNLDVFPLI